MKYLSSSNLFWLRECRFDLADDFVPEQIAGARAAGICAAFGLFGTAEECLARLKRAQNDSGSDHVFIFPTHIQDDCYEMPTAEVEAFKNVIFPGIDGFG